ncbi:hypothetical protein HYU92_03715 [Candidatus Curtissbacteria bacterium]|nr:hypothetical protein [Candidatus Curtissbacteria bacterium]
MERSNNFSLGRLPSLFRDGAKASLFSLIGWNFGPAVEAVAVDSALQPSASESQLDYNENLVDVGDTKVNLVGVAHSFWTAMEFQEEFRNLTSKAPFTVLEYFGEKEQRALEAGRINSSSLSDLFFAFVGGISARQNKDIIVVNPETDEARFFDDLIKFGLPTALIASDAEHIFRKILQSQTQRRTVLKLFAYSAASLSWASQFDSYRQMQEFIEGKYLEEIQPGFRWNLVDFRDAISAKSISTVIEEYSGEIGREQEIPVIQGLMHTPGTKKYLEEPASALKMLGYAHFKHLSEPIRRYHYDTRTKKWQLVDQFSDISSQKPKTSNI